VITIEDAGLGMSQAALQRAEEAVSSEQLDLTTLSGTRLGLAVVGCLARKYGLTVSFRPSSRGGTGVVVMIPRRLITEVNDVVETPRTASVAAPAEPESAAVSAPAEAEAADPPDGETGGLPKRRRGQTLASTARPAATSAARTAASRPSDAAARFSTFREAIQTGRTTPDDRPEGAADDVPHDET
jgi:hypothetical protein